MPTNTASSKTPRTSFQTYYFLTFSFLAFWIAFLPLYWESLGFDKSQLALMSLAGTVATLFSGPLSLDFSHKYMGARLLALVLFILNLIVFLPQIFAKGFYLLLVSWFLCLVCRKGMHALLDARAIRAGAEGEFNFERVRIWGSIGFILSTLACGLALDFFGADKLVLIGAGLLVSTGFGAYFCKDFLGKEPARLADKLANKLDSDGIDSRVYLLPVVALILVNVIIWATHTPYYVYFSVYLSELGWSGFEISAAWTIGVLAEVIYFRFFYLFERRFSLVNILRQAIIMTALRWLILASTTALPWLILAQVLHMFSFGACYLASVKLVFKLLPDDYRDRGQGFLVALGHGLGACLGRVLASFGALSWAIPEMFMLSSAIALLALPLTFLVSKGLILEGNSRNCE